MAQLEFPSSIGWTQRYFTGNTLAPDLGYTNLSYFFTRAQNAAITVDFDTSKVTSTSYMFDNAGALTYVPLFDTSNVTNMSYMFYQCKLLSDVPLFDTSNVTNMNYMFANCVGLTTIPEFDFSNVTNMEYMFYYCENLTELPNINCKKTTSLNSWLNYAVNIQKIGIIDCDSLTSVSNMLGNSSQTLRALTDVGGFRNLGAKSSLSGTNTNYFLNNTPNLTRQSLLNIFNGLYDRASAGYSVVTIKLHANHHTILTEEDKAIATNKGWALS